MNPIQGLRAALRTGSQLVAGLLLLLLTSGSEHAQAQQPGFLTNGLVAYYPFNGNANDESGNRNHGANLGGVSDVDRNGKLGGAYRFVDGQYVNVPHSDSLNFGDKKPMTVAFWVKRQAGEAHLLGKRAGQNDCSFQVNSGAFHGSAGNWRAGLSFDVPADPNQWSYITYTFDGDRMAAFINGQLQTSQTGRVLGPLSTAPIKIGSFWGMFLKGSLDEVRFYNRGLSDAEVAALYAYESTPPDNSFITNGLVAYYPFNGNANDESGNGKHGVYSGAYGEDRNWKFGSALRLDGNAFVDAPNPVQNQITEPTVEPREITYSAWFNYQSGPPRMFLGSWGGAGGNGPNIRYDTYWGTNNICVNMPQSWVCAPFMNRSGEPDFNRWVHIGLTWKAGQYLKLYLDGKLVGSSKDGGTGVSRWNGDGNPPDRISIGGWTGHGGISGSVDDVRIYNRALSDAEISALYAYESTPPVPTVVTAPVNQTVGVGQTLSLSAEISGAGLAYRWQKDGVDLMDGGQVSGAATASLTITGVTLADAGQYRLTASNGNGNAATAAATVSVIDGSTPPAFINQGLVAYYPFNGNANDASGAANDGVAKGIPVYVEGRYPASKSIKFGQVQDLVGVKFKDELVFNREFSINMWVLWDSDGAPTYQHAWNIISKNNWYGRDGISVWLSRNGGGFDIVGETGGGMRHVLQNGQSFLDLFELKIVNGSYSGYTRVPSKTWKMVTVVNSASVGVAGRWKIFFDGRQTFQSSEYQIPADFSRGEMLLGGSVNYNNNEVMGGLMDDVRIYNRALSDSEVATLYAYESIPPVAPTFTAQPQSADGMEGESVRLSVTASGSPAPTFQWFKNGAALVGKTAATLELNPLQPSDAGTYHVVAANAAGSVASSEAVVTVTPPIRYLVDGNPITGTARIVGPVMVGLQFGRPDWLLFYTLDGSTPDFLSNPYGSPFPLDRSADVRVVAYSPDFASSTQLPALAVRRVQSQGITWGSLPVLRYLEKGTVTASASSGLPVVLSVVSGPGTVSGTELTATGVGPVVLRALQVGSDEFAPVVSEQTVVVAKAAQTLNWPALPNRTFGDAAFGVPVTASSGLGVTLSVSSGKATWSGSTLSLTGAGTVVLSATQLGNSLYESASESRTFEVAKGAQTLTFVALADRTYSVDPIPLVASASSGLPVAFEVVSGPGQIAGNKVTVTGTGAVTVRAVQSGNADWLAAPAVDRTFVVSKATQTLTFTPVGSKAYGDAPVDLVATSSSGLPVSFRVVSGPGTIDGKTLSFSIPGNIVVQAYHAGNDLYQAASASQTVVVTKASQAITFAPIPDTGYTTSALVLSATAKSQLPVTFRLVGGPATVTGAQLQLTGLGTVSVAAEQAGDGNWLAAPPVTNRFTVTRGTQTITFDPVLDQILGNPPITLRAVSSAALPMLYEMVSGPATIVGSVLTLNGEGRVTIRARQLGSPLWLPAQVDQSFEVVNRTTLSVVVEGNSGGTVAIDPVKERYLPTETVTLRADPATGFRFRYWSGALTGSQNPTTLSMVANRSVVAVFQDIAQPVLSWDQPVAGTTSDQNTRISGVVTDNVGVSALSWSRDGGAASPVVVDGAGRFAVEGIVLSAGQNRFRLAATDAAGNEIVQERTVVWVPDRVLKVADAAEVQEGQRMVFPLQLEARNADVAGMTFRLEYDPVYLTDPQVEWSAAVGQSVNSLNLSTPGLVSASFALAGTALPAGTNPVATVSFRARSVPVALAALVRPKIVNLSSPSGVALNTGNAAELGEGRILPRKIKGDNNANQRLDVGDAVVISRLQVGLEEVRSWDVALNDLNISGDIDSGDVVRALRVVVGLDPQPQGAPRGGELSVESRESREERVSTLNSQPRRSLRLAGNTNDVLGLEFPDGDTAKPGVPWRVVVKLAKAGSTISGLSFVVGYPQSVLTLTGKQVGALVPSDSLPLWAENPGSVSLAAVRSTAWPTSTGVAAVLTFLPGAGITGQATWPLVVSQAEITGSGFDIRPVDTVNAVVKGGGGGGGTVPPVVVVPPPAADGKLNLQVEAPVGSDVVLETTTDLSSWSVSQRATGQGPGKPVTFPVVPENGTVARFWRVRVP